MQNFGVNFIHSILLKNLFGVKKNRYQKTLPTTKTSLIRRFKRF
jgi:hypothetical protein